MSKNYIEVERKKKTVIHIILYLHFDAYIYIYIHLIHDYLYFDSTLSYYSVNLRHQ